MTKKAMQVVSRLAIFNKSKIVIKILTMLLLFGTIQTFAASSMLDAGIVSSGDLQQRQVTGLVTDAEGSGLAGVNVLEVGTINGAITDVNGAYSLTVASSSSVLNFSFIGYTAQSITVGTQTVVNVVLQAMLTGLDEIVVVGYSTQARKTLTGSVSTVSADKLSENTSSSVAVRLQGNASGVQILNSHTPGGGATIRIRGMGTINDNNPLWVVDGVPGGEVAPNDIETISILKDAAAQAIYGARAANGVVLVTTKTGSRNQAARVTINVRSGMSKNINYYDMLNTNEWGEMLWLEAANGGVANFSHPQYGNGATPQIANYVRPAGAMTVDESLYDNKLIREDGDDTYIIMKTSQPGTEWLKEIDRNAKYREYTIDVTGGSANTVYAFQGGYLLEEGILNYTSFDRYNIRSNITTTPAKWIELGEKIGITYQEDKGTQGDNGEGSMIAQSYRMVPWVPVYDIMGGYAGSRAEGAGNGRNPLFQLDANQNDINKRVGISGNAHVKINIMEGLSVRSMVGINWSGSNGQNWGFVEKAFSERGTYASYSESANFNLQWSWTNTIEYGKTFAGVHDIKLILGSEAVNSNSNNLSANRENYFFEEIAYMTLSTGLQSINNSGGNSSWSLYSLFGRFNYTFSDKYMLEGVVRRDGSSRFGATNAFGVFPAFSAGWRISNEDFMAGTSSWLDELKLRAGYGTIGNDRMGNYNTYTNFSQSANGADYPLSGANLTTGNTGFYQSSFGNSDVKWETTKTTNIGIDASLLGKFTVTLDLWKRVTSDMLYSIEIPDVLGNASAPSVNIGEMNNQGIDFEFGYNNTALNGDLRYSVDWEVSRYKNEIVKLSDNPDEFIQGSSFRQFRYARAQAGTAYPEFFGYHVDGIFQTQAEVDAHAPAFGATGTYNKPGRWIYRDANNDGVVDSDDRVYLGLSPHPDFTTGMSINIQYKDLTLTSQLYASVGNEMVNYAGRWMNFKVFQGGFAHSRLYESWGSPYLNGDNSKAKYPAILANDIRDQEGSTAFIEDASYLRMKILRVSYNLSNVLGNKVRNLQVYGQVSNLFTLTGYSGLDPEVNAGGINMGVDQGAWPTPRQIMFGVTLGI